MNNGGMRRKIEDGVGNMFRELKALAMGEKSIHDTIDDVCNAERGGDVTACPTPGCVVGAAGHEGRCSPVRVVKEGGAA